jgi:hypothetical protein
LRYGEREFALNERQSDGATLREHMAIVAQQGGQVPDDAQPLELPAALAYLWRWFLDLSNARSGTGFGPAPITQLDLLAWCALHEVRLLPFELEAIRALDFLYLSAQATSK